MTKPDEQRRGDRDQCCEPTYFSGFGEFEKRRGDEGNYRGADSFERGFDSRQFFPFGEHRRDREDDEERRKDCT